MFLNDFNKESVIEVYKELKNNNRTDLFFLGENLENIKDEKYLVLMYDECFHRVFLWKFYGLLYQNPDENEILCPRDIFIKRIKPSKHFKKLMKT